MEHMKLRHQPRILDVKRITKGGAFHPDVEIAIKTIARSESKSYSWVISQIVSDFFGIDCTTGIVYDRRKLRKAS